MQHESRHGDDTGAHDREAQVVGRAGRWGGGGAAVQVLVAVGVAVAAWWVVALEPFSGQATLAVLFAGAAAMAVGARQRHGDRRRPRPRPAERRAGVARWAVLCAAAGAWQLAAYVQQPRADHPTVSSLTNAVLDARATRAVAFVLWLAAARALARR